MAWRDASPNRQLWWIVLAFPFTMLFTWLALQEWEKYGSYPSSPVETTMEQLVDGGGAPWMVLTDGAPLCDQNTREKNKETVVVASRDGRYLVPLRLHEREFCATLPMPLVVVSANTSPYQDAPLLERARQALVKEGVTLVKTRAQAVELKADAKQDALGTMGLMALLAAVSLIVQGIILRNWKAARTVQKGSTASGQASSAAAPGAGEVLESLASGMAANAQDVLLAGPQRLTSRAQKLGWRAKHLGAPALMVGALAGLVGAGWSASMIVSDVLAWRRGVPVPAEAKGKITRYQLIGVNTDVDVLYLPPNPDGTVANPDEGGAGPRQANVSFMTWFVGPDTRLGDVRVPADDPDHVVVEDAVTLWPWRAINPLLLLLLMGLLAFASVHTFKNADRLPAIAQDPEEVVLEGASWTEMRVNGQRTGYTVHGVVRGVPVKFSVGPNEGPATAVYANGDGDLVVLRARNRPEWRTLLQDDLFPFQVDNATRVRVQAVLQARGSPTRIRT